jgi:8-oxo-dGTP pyrophosphatase MutT (NUDIX family)
MTAERRTPRQVAVVAVRRRSRDLEVCLIRRRTSNRWGVPKGFIEQGDTPEQAALTEADEEAGLLGEILGRSIGVYEYDKRGETLRVAVYVMLVTDARKRWSEMAFRERGWFALDEAVRLLKRHPVAALWQHVVREIGG